MQFIKVKKEELLAILKENRAKHQTIVKAATDTYREMAIRELDNMLADAKAGRQFSRSLSLVAPVDQTKDYDRVIRMIELSVDDTVELGEIDVQRYVQDDWQWKRQFSLSNRAYLTGKAEASLLDAEMGDN